MKCTPNEADFENCLLRTCFYNHFKGNIFNVLAFYINLLIIQLNELVAVACY